MAEALTRKQVIQAVWNKFKAIIGNKDISGIGDGTVTGALVGLNGKLNGNDWTNIPNKATIIMTEATINLSSLSEGVYCGNKSINPFPNALYVFAESGRKQSSGITCNAKYDKNNKILYASAPVAGTYYINVYGVYQNNTDNT